MKREALMVVGAAAMLVIGAGAGNATEPGTVKSLSDLNGGLKDYQYIYPHADYGTLPPDRYTNVAPVRPAPNAAPLPQQADVPLDVATPRPGGSGAQR